MLEYRLYCLGGDGRFKKAHDITAKDDDEALAKAKGLNIATKCELWESGRLVAEFTGHFS